MRTLAFILLAGLATPAVAADAALEQQFATDVRPVVGKFCTGCHGGAQPAAQFDLKSYTALDQVVADFPRWQLLSERLAAHEMPPKGRPAPSQEQLDKIIGFVQGVRGQEIKRFAGDPGLVLARRLSNVEYNYTVRDLTGQDMQLTRQFPVDPANQSGFDNSGESLTMSPALLNKYLQAARLIADHMVLKPDGIDFAPHLMQVDSDRDRYTIGRIIDFYKAAPTDYARYFEAAWRFRYRAQLGQPKATLASIAGEMKLSAKYLPMVWGILHDQGAIGPVAKLQAMFNALPAPANAQPIGLVQAGTVQMKEFVTRIRAHTAMQFYSPVVADVPGQSQPLHYWRLAKYAAHHRDSDPADLRADNEPAPKLADVPKFPGLHMDASPRWALLSANARAGDTDLIYPAGQKAKYQKAFARFASVFPDSFYVSERGRYWPDNSVDQGRLLSAGFHNSMGYFRDDTALMQLILDRKQQQQLDRLWDEFDFVSDHTNRTYTQWFFNNSGVIDTKVAESGSPRPVGHEVTDTVEIMKMQGRYLAKAAADPKNDKEAALAIRAHFARVDATLRKLEKERKAAEPKQLAALVDFAQRAYRRPLTTAERADILAYYHSLRDKNRLSHDAAIHDSLVGILMSPDFLYRFDLSKTAAVPEKSPAVKVAMGASPKPFTAEPLSPYALASRLSYFLWSSMPDAELMKHAASGDITQPKVLVAQARRMLKDPKMSGLATEFTGNWLVFRQFETNNSIDRQRFPSFNDDLREAMFQEPIHFMQDTIARDGSVLDLLYGDYTFVNPPLAKHYGMPEVSGDNDHWVRVDDAGKYGRGGILPMAVFMTQNSPGLRTSPVKRGNWVVQKVLGIRVPPPPPVVPELPNDEAKTEKPIREMLAEHHKNPFCASCHLRFDGFGLAFEGYGPVGDARIKDMAGRPVDASADYPGGYKADGVPGLRAFIKEHRQTQFVENISRKLLSYALNRSLQMSDEALVDQMKQNLAADDYRFSALVETIVASPQFRTRRLPETTQRADARTAPVKFASSKGN